MSKYRNGPKRTQRSTDRNGRQPIAQRITNPVTRTLRKQTIERSLRSLTSCTGRPRATFASLAGPAVFKCKFGVMSTVFCQKGLSAISKTFQEAEKTDFRQHMAL